jgi:cell division protein FtsL
MKRKKKRSLKRISLWGFIMVVFIAELLFYTWSRVQCTQIGYEITRANETQQQGLRLQNNLKIELARLKSPARIATYARERLGLRMPTPEQTIILP